MRWEPWTRASLAAPAFACLCFGLLVVLDEARRRFGCGCEVAVVSFAGFTRFGVPAFALAFACFCLGLLVVLEEARTPAAFVWVVRQRHSATKASFLGAAFAFIVDLSVVVASGTESGRPRDENMKLICNIESAVWTLFLQQDIPRKGTPSCGF